MFVRNQKGQAFDVFKLLIAAVVALAILAVLWPILTGVGFGFVTEPNEGAGTKIKNITQGHLSVTEKVTFKKEGALTASAISNASGGTIDASQVCVHAGDFADSEEVFTSLADSKGVLYKGANPRDAKLSVLCDSGDRLEEDLAIYETAGRDFSAWANECGCVGVPDKCCIVAVRFNT